MRCSGVRPPDETSTTSTPSAASRRDTATVSSSFQPPGAQSVAESRTSSGRCDGHADLTARVTSSSRRARFSKLPPYSSVRSFARGDRNWCSRYPCAAWISTASKPARMLRRVALAKSAITFAMSSTVIARGLRYVSVKPSADGPTTSQPPSSSGTPPRPRKGAKVLALRPACASCTATRPPCLWTKSLMSASFVTCSSRQIPRSSGEMRPSGLTAVASVTIRPAPPSANCPRCTRWKSFA